MQMSKLKDLENVGRQGSDVRDRKMPEAWRPRLEVDEKGGFFVSTPQANPVGDVVDLLSEFDLDPEQWTVTGVRRSKWQRYDEEWLHSYRVSVVPRSPMMGFADLGQLETDILKWRPTKASKPTKGDRAFVVSVGDTQWGKDAGDGSAGTVDRVMSAMESAAHRHRELKDRGIGTIVLPQMGDCIEGLVSQGGRITGRLDLALTSQIRLGRRVLFEWVKRFAPLTDRLIIPVVPGNHDESTRQVLTDPTDSFQIDIVSQVLDMCKENPALQHVEARYPEPDNSTLAVEIAGTLLGFAHGHQTRQTVKWWEGQALGDTPVGNADILITGHYHHLRIENVGKRLWIQIPSLDGGSAWFRDRRGYDSPHGVVSLVVGADYDPRRDLAVLQ
jgi:predicted phosphodiesterase